MSLPLFHRVAEGRKEDDFCNVDTKDCSSTIEAKTRRGIKAKIDCGVPINLFKLANGPFKLVNQSVPKED